MTGLWQISGRSDLSFDDLVRLDFYYLENWSIWLDISILAKTLPAVLVEPRGLLKVSGTTGLSAAAFAKVAESYERRRPGYPPELVSWMAERSGSGRGRPSPTSAPGTGKLTRSSCRPERA